MQGSSETDVKSILQVAQLQSGPAAGSTNGSRSPELKDISCWLISQIEGLGVNLSEQVGFEMI